MNEEIVLENTEKRFKGLKIFLFFLLFCILLFFFYMHSIEPKLFQIKEQAIIDVSLPEEFNGFKIVHFSDIHYGSTINDTELKRIVKKINHLKADVVIFTGDLFDDSIHLNDSSFDTMKEILKQVNAKFRKYAVIGNHDYVNKEKFMEIMQESEFLVLENMNDLLFYKGTTPLEFIGTSSSLEGENDIDQAIITETDSNSYFKIWLNHEPIILDELVKKDIHPNLLFTSHHLGGLINIPFYGYLLNQEGISKYKGNYYHKKRIQMYVSNGLGTYKYPVRFMNAPSLNFYRLYNN